jgi:hypothetical protein
MIKRVWEVCEPHPDVFQRDMDPSVFAASLHAVKAGTADPDYTDPQRFFEKTFMTQSLESVLERVLARLLGQPGRGAPLLRLETPFGGGKTHTMVALYHLARSPEAVEGAEVGDRLCQTLNLRQLPRDVRVAVIDGAALNPQGYSIDGLTIRTLWGELAYQLLGRPGYEAFRDADEARIAPGQAAIADLLRQTQPLLILMDELMHYLAKAMAIRVGDSTLAAQTVAFLRELGAAVSEAPQAVLILSVPASSLEVPTEDKARAEELFQSVRKVLGRTELIETPVAQDEVFGVLKRRLFSKAGDERIAKRAREFFQKYYDQYKSFFPERLRSPQYLERMEQAYPFHPELIDLLYQRWGPHPQFQRTRGALKLMALVLRRLWMQRPGSCYLIQPHHIDLADRDIRPQVVHLLDGGFDNIIAGDIVERAREVDTALGGDYATERLAVGAASCVLLYSISAGAQHQGCTEEELRVALLRPPLNPAQSSEVLVRLRQRLWYMRYRQPHYLFTAKPNLNKVILDFEQNISDEEIERALGEHLRQVAGVSSGELTVVFAPTDPLMVNEPQRATLLLLPLSLGDMEEMQRWMKTVFDRITARGRLVFLAPDKSKEGAVRAATRQWLALQRLLNSSTFSEMEKEDREEVRHLLKDRESEIHALLLTMYNKVFRPSADGVEELKLTLKRDGKKLVEMVQAALEEKGILVKAIDPTYLAQTLELQKQQRVSFQQVEAYFSGNPNAPLVPDTKRVIPETIKEGIKRGEFAVEVGGQVYTDDVPEEVLKQGNFSLVIPPEEPISPPPTQPKRAQVVRVSGSVKNMYPLRKMLETIQGLDVSIEITLKDPTGALSSRRKELEGIFEDYMLPYNWDEQTPT